MESRSRGFVAQPILRNGHLMTVVAALWPRRFPRLPSPTPTLLEVAPESRLRLECHWQPQRRERPALVLVHGLEGSSQSHYMLGTAEKAWGAGFSAVRVNVRNCGGTEHLTPTLYHSGLSEDIRVLVGHLLEELQVPEVHLVGFSMGGNMVLKLAGEWGNQAPKAVASVAAVSPAIELGRCADALHRPSNRIYEWKFLWSLKARLRRKARLFPDRYQTAGLSRIGSVREFDDRYTGPHCGFGTADNYYARASSLPFVARIALPAFILAAQDDPFIPIESFYTPALRENPHVTLVTPTHGGHVGFLARASPNEDRWWAENRVVEFCRTHSQVL